MLFSKTERLYKQGQKKFIKHGSWDKEQTYSVVKRTTIWFLFIPLLYWEKVVKSDLV